MNSGNDIVNDNAYCMYLNYNYNLFYFIVAVNYFTVYVCIQCF